MPRPCRAHSSSEEAYPLYLRPVAILVRPGNPKNIRGFRDLLAPNVRILTVAGAGQIGLWEDVAGRTGDIALVRAFRKNMVFPEAANSGAAKEQWTQQKDIDAWLIWNIWQVANPDLAQLVPLDEPFRIYRDAGVVLTRKGKTEPQAAAFIEFLKSADGQRIFAKWGWETRRGPVPPDVRAAARTRAPRTKPSHSGSRASTCNHDGARSPGKRPLPSRSRDFDGPGQEQRPPRHAERVRWPAAVRQLSTSTRTGRSRRPSSLPHIDRCSCGSMPTPTAVSPSASSPLRADPLSVRRLTWNGPFFPLARWPSAFTHVYEQAMRSQALVHDDQFIASTIPHHSGAIFTRREARLADAESMRLARDHQDQREEISRMESIERAANFPSIGGDA